MLLWLGDAAEAHGQRRQVGLHVLDLHPLRTTDRLDGSTYHITWSLGPGRRAVESNDVLRDLGWEPIDAPIPVELEPARF